MGRWMTAAAAAHGYCALQARNFRKSRSAQGGRYGNGANGEGRNVARYGFNDRASSVIVESGRWEACEHEQFGGRCVVLRPGSYDSLAGMGLDNSISSVRPLQRNAQNVYEAPPAMAVPTYEYRQRPNERLYQANVTAVRAVVGPPEN